MIQFSVRLVPGLVLCLHCSTDVGASSNEGGYGGSGGSAGSGAANNTGAGAGTGASAPADTPADYATATCAAREACENDPSCVAETTCYFHMFRAALRPALQECLSDCSLLDDCFLVATEQDNPATYGPYHTACLAKIDACPQMGDDWCGYNYFESAAYEEMLVCFDLVCDEVNDCLRTVVFTDAPECTAT